MIQLNHITWNSWFQPHLNRWGTLTKKESWKVIDFTTWRWSESEPQSINRELVINDLRTRIKEFSENMMSLKWEDRMYELEWYKNDLNTNRMMVNNMDKFDTDRQYLRNKLTYIAKILKELQAKEK